MSQPVPDDTRGIIAPGRMMRFVAFERHPAPPQLAGLVDWFWSVAWDLPRGLSHPQQVLSQPGLNVSAGNPPPDAVAPPPGPHPLREVVTGVTTRLATRVLTGRGWNVAAKTTTGGFGAWVDDVRRLTDRAVPASEVLGPAIAGLAERCDRTPPAEVARRLGEVLAGLLAGRDPARVELAREVGRVAGVAERDRSVRRVEELAALAGVSPRTLQRMFASCAGVSPAWVIRRSRLLDAAELVRAGDAVDWAAVAADLGYADQAHLTRDFTGALGVSPAAYARQMKSAE